MANKLIKWFVIGMVIFPLFVACSSEKDRYVVRYTRFATNVIQNSSTFTPLDWEAAVAQYEELRYEYRYHTSEMTLEERQRISDYNNKINAIIVEHTTEETVETIKGFINELMGTIEQLAEWFNFCI